MFKQLSVIDYTIKNFGALFNLIRVYELVKDNLKNSSDKNFSKDFLLFDSQNTKSI